MWFVGSDTVSGVLKALLIRRRRWRCTFSVTAYSVILKKAHFLKIWILVWVFFFSLPYFRCFTPFDLEFHVNECVTNVNITSNRPKRVKQDIIVNLRTLSWESRSTFNFACLHGYASKEDWFRLFANCWIELEAHTLCSWWTRSDTWSARKEGSIWTILASLLRN